MTELKEADEILIAEPQTERHDITRQAEQLMTGSASPQQSATAKVLTDASATTHRGGFRFRPAFSLNRGHASLMLLAVAMIAGVFAWLHFRQAREVRKPDEAASVAPPSDLIVPEAAQLSQLVVEPVGTQTVIEDRNTTGRVSFNEDRQTPVFTPYAGRIIEVLSSRGDSVRAGQPLVVIESPEVIAAFNDLSAARSDADKSRIALEAAQKAAERARRLHEREAIATRDLQQAETDLARVQEEARRADAAVAIAENRLALFGKTASEIQSGTRTSELRSVDRRITIRAPIAGTIVDRRIGPGQYIKPDAPDPMFLIADLSTLWVQADVYESDLAAVKAGAPVLVSVEAYPNRTFPARITFISPTVDPATRTVRVRCQVSNQQHLLKPDMFARIRIAAAQRDEPVVPASAVVSAGSDSVVFVEASPGHFRERRVSAGTEQKGQVVITSGLQPGERVVTKGALLLK
ncbi:MAG: efflux RND transporter periplasmic adaptor subunit [Blastocatellia bacterium]